MNTQAEVAFFCLLHTASESIDSMTGPAISKELENHRMSRCNNVQTREDLATQAATIKE